MSSRCAHAASDIPLQQKERPLPIDVHSKLQVVLSDTRPNFILIPSLLDIDTTKQFKFSVPGRRGRNKILIWRYVAPEVGINNSDSQGIWGRNSISFRPDYTGLSN